MCRYELAAVVLAAVVLVLTSGCGSVANGAHHRVPVVLAQAHGICPTQVVYGKTPPPECFTARSWNGTSPIFKTPHRQWGVAYAFNCGSRARVFSFDARMPAMDHMGLPGPELHGTHGSGSIMYSRSRMMDLIAAVPPEFRVNGHEMAIVIASPCTWRVKAVLGSPHDVASATPPVPKVARPWWK